MKDTNRSQYTSVTISEDFEVIPDSCFINFVNLVDIDLPDSLTTIGDKFLLNTKVSYLKLPKNLKSLSTANPFDNTPSISHIDVDERNNYFCSVDGILYSSDMKTLIYYPASRNSSSYMIPFGVISIGFASIYNANFLKNVIFPSSVISTADHLFDECRSLELITVFREFRQEKIKISKRSFINSNFNISNIIYIYSQRSCHVCNRINYVQQNYLFPFLVIISE